MPEPVHDPKHLPGPDLALSKRRPPERRMGPPARAAAIATGIWLALWAAAILTGSSGPGRLLTVSAVLAGFLAPIALVWALAWAAGMRRSLSAETEALRSALAATRAPQPGHGPRTNGAAATMPAPLTAAVPPEVAPPPRFVSRREAALSDRPPAGSGDADEHQPALALGQVAEVGQTPVASVDLIRALDFPDSPDDAEGFRALRRALGDRGIARLIRAAQDVLTLLAEDGIFMDDLTPERARVELWRRFARGERGRAVAPLGGVRDRSSLALSAARMRSDTVFRDACHHFLRQFDRVLADCEPLLSDPELAGLSDTRTARAFMLLGRVTGIFD